MNDVSAASFAREMVADARGVELMEVVSRTALSPAVTDSAYVNYGQIYVYRFEPVTVLNGRGRGALELTGFDERWIQEGLPGAPFRPHEPLQWLTEQGYAELQETALPDPRNVGSIVCSAPATFVVGARYLVFRQSSGALLAPGFHGRSRREGPQRPAIEPIVGEDDPWLREVRTAISQNRKPGATFWELTFELLFSRPHREPKFAGEDKRRMLQWLGASLPRNSGRGDAGEGGVE